MAGRRNILTGAALMLLEAPAAVAKVVNPDAALLALAEEFIEISKREKGLFGYGDYAAMHVVDDDERDPLVMAIYERQEEIMDLLEDVRAKTPAGLIARVRMADAYTPGWRQDPGDKGEMIAFDLAEDVLALFGQGGAI